MQGGESVKERIKTLRKELGLSQDAFAEKLGLTKNYISLVENGNRNLSEQSIKVLCSTLDVNEEWLRTGKGKMFIERTRAEQIAEFVGSIAETDSFKQRFVAMLSALDEKDWETLQKISLMLAEETK